MRLETEEEIPKHPTSAKTVVPTFDPSEVKTLRGQKDGPWHVASGDAFTFGGEVAPGYEPVLEAFKKNYEMGLELSSQVCIYDRGVKVVDLYGRNDAHPAV